MPNPLNMASSGKKTKKSKGKTLSLNSFLQETPGGNGNNTVQIRKPSSNWADEVEDSYDSYDPGRNASKNQSVVLPTAPKAARGLDDISDRIPSQPPFNVYLSNLPYDVDEEEIADFFSSLKIIGMRIPREDRPGEGPRVKGFGYVEFADQESLIEALDKPVCTLKGRRIRIEIATSSNDDKRRGRMDMNRDRADRPEAPTGDWRSGGRQEPEGPPERRFTRDAGGGGGGGGRDFNRGGEERSGGMWRDAEQRPSFRDRDGDRPSFRDREGDRPSFRDRDGGERPSFRDREGGDRFRDDKPITRDAPPRYDSTERRGFGPRRDREERTDRPIERSDRSERMMERNDRNGGFRREEAEGVREGGEPRTRPKLNLAPRTLPVTAEAPDDTVEKAAVVEPKPPAASIFGSAKPVDTTAREREIEERLAKQTDESRSKDDDKKKDDSRRRSPRRMSPRRSPQRRRSPDHEKNSPDRQRGPQDRRRDDTRRPVKGDRNDRNTSRDNKERPPRQPKEHDMPKVKTPEPINIVGPNKYAFLEAEDDE